MPDEIGEFRATNVLDTVSPNAPGSLVLFSAHYTFSVGFRLGDWEDHVKNILLSLNHFCVDLDRCRVGSTNHDPVEVCWLDFNFNVVLHLLHNAMYPNKVSSEFGWIFTTSKVPHSTCA